MDCSMPGFSVHHQLPEPAHTHVHRVYLILCRPLLLLPSIFTASGSFPMSWFFALGGWNIGVSASASVLPVNIQDLFPLGFWISFRMDWLDLLAVQGTLKSLLQDHSSKASILWHSAFIVVQLSHPYMTTGKTIALTRRTFVGKVMSLLYNMLSRLVITFLPRSKHLLISWLQVAFGKMHFRNIFNGIWWGQLSCVFCGRAVCPWSILWGRNRKVASVTQVRDIFLEAINEHYHYEQS